MQINSWREDSEIETVDKRAAILRDFEIWLDRDEPKMGDIVDYIKQLDKAPGTVRNYFYALKDYFLWKEKQDADTFEDYARVNNVLAEILHDEVQGEIKYSYKVSDENFLTREQVREIFDNTYSLKYMLLFGMMYYWGRRVGEVTALTWRDVDLETNQVTFVPEKKDDPDSFDLDLTDPPEMLDWMGEYAEGQDTHSDEPVFDVSNRAVRLRLEKITGKRCESFDEPMGMTKAFRHSVASHLRADGVPMEVISQEVLRHKNISTTQDIYAGHITPEEKQTIDRGSLLEPDSEDSANGNDDEIRELVERMGIG